MLSLDKVIAGAKIRGLAGALPVEIVRRQRRVAVVPPLGEARLKPEIAPFDVAILMQLADLCTGGSGKVPSTPTRTFFSGCCAPAASGHAPTAPPSSMMNWRRLRSSMGSSPEPAVPAYRRLSMPWKQPQVLGIDLKCSEIAA
jgi:hypothetical protein